VPWSNHRIALRAGVRAALPSTQREYAALRGPALAVVVDAALAVGVPRLVRDLVSFVYADGGDAWLDEGSSVEVSGPLAANLAAEAEVARFTAGGGAGIVLRCGQFYGPDDALSRDELRLARRRLSVLPGRPDAWHSALHVDDVGPAVVAALGVTAGVWNVVDGEPLRRRELASVLRQAVGLPASGPLLRLPAAVSSREPSLAVLARSQRVGAAAFRAATGWVPTVGSRWQGWPAALTRRRQVRGRGSGTSVERCGLAAPCTGGVAVPRPRRSAVPGGRGARREGAGRPGSGCAGWRRPARGGRCRRGRGRATRHLPGAPGCWRRGRGLRPG